MNNYCYPDGWLIGNREHLLRKLKETENREHFLANKNAELAQENELLKSELSKSASTQDEDRKVVINICGLTVNING